ncbi:MAG: histidinol dehydrogenase [Candidatus Omnitrophica bacterium]|nr:histidinol dehydrogenase [Candidatus Omnitrophota bacterium]
MKLIKFSQKEFDKLYNRKFSQKKRIQEKVRSIVDDVRANGDEALLRYTKKFDKVKLSVKQLRVSESEISGAYQDITPDFISSLKVVIENVTKFYKRQMRKSWRTRDDDGVILGESIQPLESVGIYIPSGTAPLVSTVYMTVLPAKMAGVKRIVLATPPDPRGRINPHILVVANLLKVNEIYRIGGAQAIAAMALGTKTVPKVDKIVGPGNCYVTEAKRQVFGYVDIDMLAGPTELVVIANRYSNPNFIIADLKSQSEHIGGLSILITTSKSLIKQVKSQAGAGYIILAKNLEQAVEISNRIAPEHLEILTNNPLNIVKKIKNAGAVFLGPYSPTAVGDYVAGPSHVLPTSGTARFFSGLGIEDFIKSSHLIFYSKKALEKVRQPLEKIAGIEGLKEHLESVRVRFK